MIINLFYEWGWTQYFSFFISFAFLLNFILAMRYRDWIAPKHRAGWVLVWAILVTVAAVLFSVRC